LDQSAPLRRGIAWAIRVREQQPDLWGWADAIDFDPPTLESAYCLFETQDEKNPAIERIADTLLPSVEAAGREWLTHGDVCTGDRRVFLPVIVTNATLYACTFDAERVSMADGGLPDGEFREITFIRFRKGLATGRPGQRATRDFTDANRQQQRTVLIVNSASLAGTLKALSHREEGNRALWDAFERLTSP
jgi:hypothetical protein